MRKFLQCLLLTAALGPHAAQAQGKHAMCMERCMEEPLDPERHRQHEAKIKKIQDKKALATDPQLIKQLTEAEEDEQDKYLAGQEKVCKRICAGFSE